MMRIHSGLVILSTLIAVSTLPACSEVVDDPSGEGESANALTDGQRIFEMTEHSSGRSLTVSQDGKVRIHPGNELVMLLESSLLQKVQALHDNIALSPASSSSDLVEPSSAAAFFAPLHQASDGYFYSTRAQSFTLTHVDTNQLRSIVKIEDETDVSEEGLFNKALINSPDNKYMNEKAPSFNSLFRTLRGVLELSGVTVQPPTGYPMQSFQECVTMNDFEMRHFPRSATPGSPTPSYTLKGDGTLQASYTKIASLRGRLLAGC
jgi:hypothetical protein